MHTVTAEIAEIAEARRIDAIWRTKAHADLYETLDMIARFPEDMFTFVTYPNTERPWPFDNKLENLWRVQAIAYVMGWPVAKAWKLLNELEEAKAIGLIHLSTNPDGSWVMAYRIL